MRKRGRPAAHAGRAMSNVDLLGYTASALVLATFCMRGMLSLRVLAIASNVAFIAYAALAGIHPVLVLHALLLPMNALRLAEGWRQRHAEPATPELARR